MQLEVNQSKLLIKPILKGQYFLPNASCSLAVLILFVLQAEALKYLSPIFALPHGICLNHRFML